MIEASDSVISSSTRRRVTIGPSTTASPENRVREGPVDVSVLMTMPGGFASLLGSI